MTKEEYDTFCREAFKMVSEPTNHRKMGDLKHLQDDLYQSNLRDSYNYELSPNKNDPSFLNETKLDDIYLSRDTNNPDSQNERNLIKNIDLTN
eukprot:CAMPEP_0116919260 /NCGR_PEP_ID=MMETSP0467-20121206/20274_1 /TAXON_ID=283647 /ORGANISM="Mesodinium pulex, Strain SPMC105" /LENGTH=92 /DNA_ID=CAMNT_0004596793 /DNA_START=514 /DNA_END=792 /DNA_ORIENTATION=-